MQLKTTSAMLYLYGISVSFDGFKALNELSFVIEPGEMRAIIGPNGAGKTTMMDVITGKTRPDNGEVYFGQGAYDLSKLDETQIAELGIGRKFQKPTVFDMHTVEDNLRLALKGERRGSKTTFWRETAARQARARRCSGARPRPSRRASTRSSGSRGSARCARASPAACRTDRSSGSRSA